MVDGMLTTVTENLYSPYRTGLWGSNGFSHRLLRKPRKNAANWVLAVNQMLTYSRQYKPDTFCAGVRTSNVL